MNMRINRNLQTETNQKNKSKVDRNISFQKYLYEELQKDEGVKISAHAKERIEERNINLEENDMEALKGAISNLEKKGAKESLIFYRDMALIASIKNRTIITAMDRDKMDIVTNIDSALIIK